MNLKFIQLICCGLGDSKALSTEFRYWLHFIPNMLEFCRMEISLKYDFCIFWNPYWNSH